MNRDALRQLEALRDFDGKAFKALCYAPWVALSFYPTGLVSACCSSRREPLGNVREHTLREIWSGERIRRFREELRAYRFPGGCRSCAVLLDAGRVEGHQIHDFDGFAVQDGDDVWPARLEFALSNTCNLACVMCSGTFSSVIRRNEGLPPMERVYGDRFFAELEEFLPHARSTSHLGGEPFLQRECYRIWDMLVAMGRRVPCQVTTNGTVWNDKVERVLAELPFRFAISIDGVTKSTVESVRRNAGFEALRANVQRFRDYLHAAGRPDGLQLNFCVLRGNWHELPDFFLWAEELGARVWTSVVAGPEHLSLLTLPRAELAEVVAALHARADAIEGRLTSNAGRLRDVVRQLESQLRDDALLDAGEAHFGFERGPLERAQTLVGHGDVDGGIRIAAALGPEHPEWYAAQCFVAGLRTDRGEIEVAAQALDAAIARRPELPEARLRRAWLHLVRERIDDAAADLTDVRARIGDGWLEAPEIGEGLLLLEARLALRRGEAALARARVEELLARNPDHGAGRVLFRELASAPG